MKSRPVQNEFIQGNYIIHQALRYLGSEQHNSLKSKRFCTPTFALGSYSQLHTRTGLDLHNHSRKQDSYVKRFVRVTGYIE